MKTEPKTETATHTPGPWMVNENVSKKGELGIVANSAPCVIAHGMSEKHWPEIAAANAALIAAAPELLEALRKCVRIVGEYRQKVITGHLTGTLIEGDYEPYAAGLAAIAKAEGRAT